MMPLAPISALPPICDEYNGICTKCGAIRHGETEPDAKNYPCRKCKTNSVVGIETAMLMGLLEIT